MAKNSPDSDEEKRRCLEEDTALLNSLTPFARYMTIVNMDRIKSQAVWVKQPKPEIYKNTYFVLPSPAEGNLLILKSILFGQAPVDIGDFVKFWHELADQHKERRLMADYLCAVRGIEEMSELEEEDKNILRQMISEYTGMYRLLLIEGQHPHDQKEFQETVSVLIKPAIGAKIYVMHHYFTKPYVTAIMAFKKMKGGCEAFDKISHYITREYSLSVMTGFLNLYTNWASFNTDKVVSYAENQLEHDTESVIRVFMAKDVPVRTEADRKNFMQKVKASVPHWNKTDRAKIFGIIEKSGNGPNDFMTRLIEEVGLEQFKVLALGKEYLCANCKRSSFVGEERLWCCPRCHKEDTYPRARYCDENCQKADWIKHKMELHSVDVCNTCKKKAAPNQQLGRCSRCIQENIPNPAHYCDKICQTQDWRKHKQAMHTKKE